MSQNKSAASNADKKAQVLKQGRSRSNPMFAALLFGLVALALAVGGYFVFSPGGAAPSARADQIKDGRVVHSVAQFDDHRAKHFKLSLADGIEVRYFVIKSSDGVIRAAFDACDVCWRSNKGYSQDGDVMVCNNCGRHFASVKVNEVKGGCNPAPLARRMEGDKLVISVKDIVAGKRFFDFRQS